MRKVIFVLISVAMFAACQQGAKDPKAQLESLKKERDDISAQIKKLEADIAAKDTTGNKEKPKLVSVQPVQPAIFQHFVDVEGKVEADLNVNVSAEMPGTVTSILVAKGDVVKKGQVLATMDAGTVLAQIEGLKKNWELANTMYEKQKALYEQNIGTEVQYLQMKNQKESLEKNLETLQQQYEMTKIKSPINGTVDEVFAKIGQTASPGYPTFRVVNLTQMKVTAQLAERYAGKVKVGDAVTVSFPDANKQIMKKITAVSQVIDPSSRSFTIDIRLSSEDQAFFHPNMIAVLKICDYTNQQALTVPINTVQNTEDGKFVFIASNAGGKTTAMRQPVSVGLSYGDQMEILNGLKSGDQVITVGYQDLSSGQPLTIGSPMANK